MEVIEKSNIRVFDLNGKIIFSDKVSNLELYSINCGLWVNGVYFIIIDDAGTNIKTLKLIITK